MGTPKQTPLHHPYIKHFTTFPPPPAPPPPIHLNHEHGPRPHTQSPISTNVRTLAAKLKDIDDRLDAAKIPADSKYRIKLEEEERTFEIPIPTDGYYRVPSLTGIFETTGGRKYVLSNRVFRSFRANIPEERITILRTLPKNKIPVLPINQLLANIPIKDKNTKDLKSLILPPASKYHLVSGTNDISIGLDKYTQIRAAATITTPVGTFRTKADRVVCSVEYVDIKTLEQYKIRCSHSYDVKLITLRERGQVPELEHDDYVEECTLFAWSNVIFNKGPLSRFTSPALKPRVT